MHRTLLLLHVYNLLKSNILCVRACASICFYLMVVKRIRT